MTVDTFKNEANSEDADSRQRSTIAFPYKNQDDAIIVARAIHSNTGHHPASFDQLAGWMNMSPKSSGFKVSVSTAKMFGLIANAATGHYKLTNLGIEIVDQSKERVARATSFLAVPLYKKVYETYQGSQLPPEAALERALTQMGVAPKQRPRARRVLLKSAEQAGFFATSNDRLIMPAFAGLPPAVNKAETSYSAPTIDKEVGGVGSRGGSGGNGGGGLPPELDPLLQGLIARIPKSGTDWPRVNRKKWLEILEKSLDLIYEDINDINWDDED